MRAKRLVSAAVALLLVVLSGGMARAYEVDILWEKAFGGPDSDYAIDADVTNDGIVDGTDFARQASQWQLTGVEMFGDFNRDGIVNMSDVALLTDQWLKMTTWY